MMVTIKGWVSLATLCLGMGCLLTGDTLLAALCGVALITLWWIRP